MTHQSTILSNWLSARDGGASRAGVNIQAVMPPNSITSDLTADQLSRLLGATSTAKSGAVVTAETALRVTTVYGCVALISGTIASLPLCVYERSKGTRKKVEDHEYWWMLNESANDDDTTAVVMEYLLAAKLFYGDGFARLLRPGFNSARVIGYKPYHPTRVEPFRYRDRGERMYRVTNDDGSQEVLYSNDIIHLPSLGFDGLRSPSPITYSAREAIGNSLAAEEFSSKFFAQGSTHDIALRTEKNLTTVQADALRASYLAKYGGGANARTPLILTGGLTAEKLSITPVDAALLPTRQFTVEEICRVFGVPPFMVGAATKATSWGSGVEQMGQGFVKYTLRRHLKPTAQEWNRKLWPTQERYFVEYDTSEITSPDFKTRMEGHRIAIGRAGEPGWITPNEVRHSENMPPEEGGDKLHTGEGAPAPTPRTGEPKKLPPPDGPESEDDDDDDEEQPKD